MAATFQGVDFYDVESLLSEEEVMIRDTEREWVDDRLMPIIGEARLRVQSCWDDHDCPRGRWRLGAKRHQDVDHQRIHGGRRCGVGADRRARRGQRIRGFLVPTGTSGFAARDQKGKLSLLASDTSELHLQDVTLPADALLPESAGLKSPLMCLTQARYGIAWGAVGAAMACFDEARRYGKERVMFDGPIGGKQIQQVRLAEMLTGITQGQLLNLQLGCLKDLGTMTPQQVSLAKRANVAMACDVAREARRLLGANGILIDYHSMRHMANLESVYTYEGTHDIHSLVLGQEITGIPAY